MLSVRHLNRHNIKDLLTSFVFNCFIFTLLIGLICWRNKVVVSILGAISFMFFIMSNMKEILLSSTTHYSEKSYLIISREPRIVHDHLWIINCAFGTPNRDKWDKN
jgi:hypothetical protein